MVGNDCGSVRIGFMVTFFCLSITRQARRKNSAAFSSGIISQDAYSF